MTYDFQYVSQELRGLIEPATKVSHRFDSPLGLRVFSDAWVAPYFEWNKSIGCVIDKEGRAIKDSECLEWKECSDYYDLNDYEQEHKKVIFLGFLLTGFGHSYTDDLRKLWFLKTDQCSSLINDGYELVYTTSWNKKIPSSVLDVFQLAGICIREAYHITRLSRFDEIIVPDNCFRATDYGRVYSREYECMIDTIKRTIPYLDKPFQKVYFTRTSFTRDSVKEYGEAGIESVFRNLGYRIVVPEDYSVIEQIQMARGCDFFAATDGSVAHMSLFCRPGANVVIINKANYLNFHQVMINEFADLNVTYIEAHHSSMANKDYPWWGPFYLCINHYLESFVGNTISHHPYWAMFSYWKYSRNLFYRCFNRTRKVLGRIRRSC